MALDSAQESRAQKPLVLTPVPELELGPGSGRELVSNLARFFLNRTHMGLVLQAGLDPPPAL